VLHEPKITYLYGGVCMRGKINILIIIGFIIYLGYLLTNKFIAPVPYEIGIPIVIFGVALIVIGTLTMNKRSPKKNRYNI